MDVISPMRTFVRVVEEGSFAAAANTLGISAQLVGKQVQGLERHLDVRLLNRTTRRQSLTDFGKAFYERARIILSELEETERMAAEAHGKPSGRLRVNAPVTFGARLLAPALPDYLRAHPQVSVELTLTNQLVDIVDEGHDVVFRVGRLADSSLVSRTLGPYPLVLCAAPAYLAAHPPIRHPRDLQAHECLGFLHAQLRTHWTFNGPEGEETVPVSGRLMTNQSEPLLCAALAGLGIMLQSLELVRDALRDGRLVEVLPDYVPAASPLNLMFQRDRKLTPKVRSFVDFCVARFTPDVLARR
ncbi:LysR family transcriptional regulator [Massilia sp. METH4]|uniref:LysR family transcriptional regulator n=1 Tax=Massilia sp. METH4 TaxID=3123041 RepID=UPI0030D3FCA5